MDDADKAQILEEVYERARQLNRRKHTQRANDFCADCGETIEAIRLKAVPYATRCIYCQSEHERMNQLYGSSNAQ